VNFQKLFLRKLSKIKKGNSAKRQLYEENWEIVKKFHLQSSVIYKRNFLIIM